MALALEAHVTSSWSTAAGPRQHLIEVTFPGAPVTVDYVSFRNSYTAAITISHTATRAEGDPLQPMHMKGRAPTWQIVVARLALMADPHCEDDAHGYHELVPARHFAKDFDHRRVTRLRICCTQPSPSWREYGLKQLRFYSIEAPVLPTLQPPPSLTDAQRELAASLLEQMSGLSRIASEIRQTIASGSSERARPGARSSGSRRVDSGAQPLAPYLVGEWADELRIRSEDAPPYPPAAASASTSAAR